MEPITITITIATALALGLSQVAQAIIQEGAVKPALKPATDKLAALVQGGYNQAKADAALQQAIHHALLAVGAPPETEAFQKYALQLGFDQLQAEDNTQLRQEIARATLLLTTPDPSLLPESLFTHIRWPHNNRVYLARFLHALRNELKTHPIWGPLVQEVNETAVRTRLQELVFGVVNIQQHLTDLLQFYGLSPGVDEAKAVEAYLKHIDRQHRDISFLFIKPAGQRDLVRTEAELEAVFVPLQVADPNRQQTQHLEKQPDIRFLFQEQVLDGRKEKDSERETLLSIQEVLAHYPVFLLKGEPGGGKTTLLRYLALNFARGQAAEKLNWSGEPLFPILVPLRNFGRFLHDHRTEYTNPAPQALRQFIEDFFRENDVALPADFFHRRLQQGHCLVLLDGLDEVADRNLRAHVAQVVSSFIKLYVEKGNRFGLASRPRGYEEVATYLPRPVECTVQRLLPETRDKLVLNLLRQFAPDDRRARREAQGLLTAIVNRPRVDELSRIPLFCTTLVLVYKYGAATLPERRVDVYQEMVRLMLGFWDIHKFDKEGTTDVRELVLLDGTGRVFTDERKAVEAKTNTLIDLAYWMQQNHYAEVDKREVVTHLGQYFAQHAAARPRAKYEWAQGFLTMSHQRSGLFVEVNPDTYAFSHQNFREYLAATALVDFTDEEMIPAVLAHANDEWWEEVILLAIAHERLSWRRREPLLKAMLQAGHVVLAGWGAVDAGEDRLFEAMRRQVQEKLYEQMTQADRPPKERFAAGEALDALGWLPPDLHTWLRCPACADTKQDLFVTKYPITNIHYELFVEAGGYETPRYWGGEQSLAWQWRVKDHPDYRGENAITEPHYWQDARFGKERHGFPVVGVSWYEATAYAAWLTELLARAKGGAAGRPAIAEDAKPLTAAEQALVADLLAAGVAEVRLPTEAEWVKIAGGGDNNRYPWDKTAQGVTQDKTAILARANTRESNIEQTSPVSMYPLGRSQPFGLMDLAGNVWEWTNSWYNEKQQSLVVRGGS